MGLAASARERRPLIVDEMFLANRLMTTRLLLHLLGGKRYVDAIGQGVVLKAPAGACFGLTVTNAGALPTTAVALSVSLSRMQRL